MHVLHASEAASLDDALAGILDPDALVLLPGAEVDRLADSGLERRSTTEWRLEPGRGGRPCEIIRGMSPADTLDRVARYVARGTIGLALGAGGAYGFAHLGVLRALDGAGIPVDHVSGASMGAIIGSAFAAGAPVARLVAFAESIAARYQSVVLRDLDLLGSALLRGTGVMRVLAELEELRVATFEQLLRPFAAVAMDVQTGEEVILDRGRVLEGIRPSFAIPGILPACKRGERLLVDGAMVNPVPVDLVRLLGADFAIASQPIPPLRPTGDSVGGLLGRVRRIAGLLPFRQLRNGIETLDTSIRSYQALWYRLATTTALGADTAVRPDLGGFWFLQFGAAERIIAAGEQAAAAALPEIERALAERIGWAAAP